MEQFNKVSRIKAKQELLAFRREYSTNLANPYEREMQVSKNVEPTEKLHALYDKNCNSFAADKNKENSFYYNNEGSRKY